MGGGRSNRLEVVIVGELITGHDAIFSREQRHSWLAGHRPLDHVAIGLARVVDKPGDGAACSVDDHVLIKVHQIVALTHHQLRPRFQILSDRHRHPSACNGCSSFRHTPPE